MSELPDLKNRLGVPASKGWKVLPTAADISAWGAVVLALQKEVASHLRDASIAASPVAQSAGAWVEHPDTARAVRLAEMSELNKSQFSDDWSLIDLADPFPDQFVHFAVEQVRRGQAHLAAVRELRGEDPRGGVPGGHSSAAGTVDLFAWLKGAAVAAALLGGYVLVSGRSED